MENNPYIEQLKERISELNPYLILLFGSYAYGTPHQDSDIDLLVVTNDEYMPKDFDERISIQVAVSKHIYDMYEKVPVDLLVYTIPMYKRFIELNSSFAQEITEKGILLYERYNKTVA